MPRLSDSMEEGTIIKWLMAQGDDVARGDGLVEIETEKATLTYEADADGVLQIVAAEGGTRPGGEVIARLDGDGDGACGVGRQVASEAPPAQAEAGVEEEAPPPAAEPEPEEPVASEAAPTPTQTPDVNGGETVKASPIARR